MFSFGLLRDEPFVFMQDGAGAHKLITLNKCRDDDYNFIAREEWPGNSPDLNPLANFWQILENDVAPPSCDNLSVTVGQCRNAHMSMLGRMDELEEAMGWLTY
jgi:hypothetical protein